MKNILQIKRFILISLISLVACENADFGDVNNDPNKPTEAVPPYLLTNALIGISANISEPIGNLYVQYLSGGADSDMSRYVDLNWTYRAEYVESGNLQSIIDYNTDETTKEEARAYGSNANQIAIATILKSWYFHTMTDRWGRISYSEALDIEKYRLPKFDTQQDIYMGLFEELDSALGMIDDGKALEGDFLLGSDIEAWKRFGNTIKMVMALRLSKADPTTGKEKFLEALNAPQISSNAQNIKVTYLDDGSYNYNPWFGKFRWVVSYIASDVFMNKLIGDGTNTDPEDPRAPKMFDVAELTGTYVGAPYGQENPEVKNYSYITKDVIKNKAASLMIYTYAEVLFARAEAAAMGWTNENAQDLYNQAIKASMDQWGVDGSQSETYIATNPYSSIEDIAYEKWVSLYLQGYNSWAEYRRFKAMGIDGRIGLTPPAMMLSNTTGIPQRQAYPFDAESLNPSNYKQSVAEQGPDDLNTVLWVFK